MGTRRVSNRVTAAPEAAAGRDPTPARGAGPVVWDSRDSAREESKSS